MFQSSSRCNHTPSPCCCPSHARAFPLLSTASQSLIVCCLLIVESMLQGIEAWTNHGQTFKRVESTFRSVESTFKSVDNHTPRSPQRMPDCSIFQTSRTSVPTCDIYCRRFRKVKRPYAWWVQSFAAERMRGGVTVSDLTPNNSRATKSLICWIFRARRKKHVLSAKNSLATLTVLLMTFGSLGSIFFASKNVVEPCR